jgi:hypothetical protein
MVYGNRVLRKIFLPNREKETEGWRKLQNVKFHNLFSLPGNIKVIKSGRMRRQST